MKVLLVGGSGHVGTFISPYLGKEHRLRVLDICPPRFPDAEYVEGSITDPTVLRQALDGVDCFINLVMKSGQDGVVPDQSIPIIVDNYSVNALGLHLLLYTAQELGIKRGVYTSTLSVHYRRRAHYPSEETVPLDSPSVYGLTKGFGEQICQYFARYFDMNLIALRITGPRTREQYLQERKAPASNRSDRKLYITDEEDLASAYLKALEAVQIGHGRFDAIYIAGDENEEEHNLSKAKRVLRWEPRAQRLLKGNQ